ncbi:hypothetical protein MMC07_000240 [Pseudocyphellaria aurata]|nr:hypothetical protein [Pseudocyphellaria aurata]
MAMTDAIRSSDVLASIKPQINFLDLEKIKKESSGYNQRLPVSAALNTPAPPLVSPSNMYSGPPPPYSYPSSTASSVIGHGGGYISPTEPRRAVDDDKEPPPSHRQHSLPSIQEALASEPPLSITSLLSKPTPLQIPQSNQNQSPTTLIPRSYPETPRGPPNTLTQQSPSSYQFREPLDKSVRPHYSPRASNDSTSSRFPVVNSHENHYTTIQPSRTAVSPTNTMRPTAHTIQPQHPSPVYERSARPPPPMNPHYPYASYHAPYSYPPPAAGIPSYQALQPPSWRAEGAEIDRAEEVRRAATSKGSPRASQYGESVKRHLDIFDLETSLNEIAKGSQLASDFARNYGIRAHQDARAGMTAESLPSIEECSEMISRQTRVLDSMNRIKDVINAQQEALKQRLSQEQRYNAPSEYDDDAPGYHDKLDGAGGFAGADAKKRRGVSRARPHRVILAHVRVQRAAPPGRCHSCNRAETPEWRRGPDGARTLCNACGLRWCLWTLENVPLLNVQQITLS